MKFTMCSSEITELAAAMIKVQQALPAAPTDRENTFTKSRYATLNSVFRGGRDRKRKFYVRQVFVGIGTL